MALEVAALHAAMTSRADSQTAASSTASALPETNREDLVESVDHVLPRLLAALALAVHTRGPRGCSLDDPAILGGLKDDRQIEKGLGHPSNT